MLAVLTGGTGFVGRYLVHELVQSGYDVRILTIDENDWHTDWNGSRCISHVVCPLSQLATVEPSDIASKEPDVFFHLAWSGTSGEARSDVHLQLQNVGFACDAVRLAAKLGAHKYVNAGSIMEYEAIRFFTQDGSLPGMNNIYSIAKMTADYMSKTVAASLGLPYVNVIISNIYGEGEKSARFLITILRKMMRGEDIPLTSGLQMYDFIHAQDACKAIRIVAEQGKKNENYYIGNATQKPLKQFIQQMKDIMESKSNLGFGQVPSSGHGLNYRDFDTEKMLREFGFSPSVSFEEGIQKMRKSLEATEYKT